MYSKMLVALLSLFGISIAIAHAAPVKKRPAPKSPQIDFKRVGGQGEVDFVVVSSDLASNPLKLRDKCRDYYHSRRKSWCKYMIWSDPKKTAHSLPMTDAQVESEVADYNINPATNLRRLTIFKKGSVIKELDG